MARGVYWAVSLWASLGFCRVVVVLVAGLLLIIVIIFGLLLSCCSCFILLLICSASFSLLSCILMAVPGLWSSPSPVR